MNCGDVPRNIPGASDAPGRAEEMIQRPFAPTTSRRGPGALALTVLLASVDVTVLGVLLALGLLAG
jgi:hypothetical protein